MPKASGEKHRKLTNAIKWEAFDLDKKVRDFAVTSRLGHGLFEYPESLVIKSYDTPDYVNLLGAYAARAADMGVIQEETGAFIALVRLAGKIVLPNFDAIEWVEIHERKNRSRDLSRLSAINFYQPHMEDVHTILQTRSVRSTNSPSDAQISLPMGQSIKFVNQGTGEWLDTEKKAEKATTVTLG